MKYKLFALDIDDTTTKNGLNTVTSEVRKALEQASKKIHITFITARAIREFIGFLDNLHLPAQYHVVENGAKVLRPDRSIVYDRHIPHDQIQEILDVARPYYLEPGFLTDEHWIDGAMSDVSVTGLSFTCVSEEDIASLKASIKNLRNEYSVYSGRHWSIPNLHAVLIFHKKATKGSGMEYIQRQLGISKEETIAVGDGMTDLSMFDAAGLNIAMANGEPNIVQAADFICPSVDKDGLVEVIHKYIHI